MKKDYIFEDEKRRECLLLAEKDREKIRERNDSVKEEKRRR